MNNLHRVQNIFISDGSGLPTSGAATTTVVSGQVGVFGNDMLALNPAGGDTISTKPNIYVVEGKTGTDGIFYLKRSMKIAGPSIISYNAESYAPAARQVTSIGYNRLTASGLIEVNNDTNYNFTIRFKNDKFLYSQRPEVLNINFQSSIAATQLTIATQITNAINGSSFKIQIVAVTVGNGTGVYGLTNATAYGVEITSKDINQFASTTYTPNIVYFSSFVNDASGFGATTTAATIQNFYQGSGTYNEIFTVENKDYMYEGVLNRRLWPIPVLDYSSSATLINSTAITPTVSGNIGEDTVTFSATVAAIIRAGEKVSLGGVLYEIKYFISTTIAVLTTPLVGNLSTAAVLVRLKYDVINIEFNDSINTPTGVVAVANKSVVIAVPAINSGGAYNSLSTAGTNLVALLNGWMATTPLAPTNISL